MKNFIQPGDIVTVAAPAGGAVSGVGYMVGNLFGIWTTTADSGNNAELLVEGVVDIGKDEAAFAVGDAVYFDDTNNLATDSSFSAGLTRIGVCIKAALTGDATVRIRLDEMITRQAQL